MRTIEIIIDSKGDASLQTKGFVGPACREASRNLEQALGVVEADNPTAEMYHTAAAAEQAAHQKLND